MNKGTEIAIAKKGKPLRTARSTGTVSDPTRRSDRVRGTLSIDSFWRAVDGDHEQHR